MMTIHLKCTCGWTGTNFDLVISDDDDFDYRYCPHCGGELGHTVRERDASEIEHPMEDGQS